MKRSDITQLFPEATKEQVAAILNLNGTDINSAKENLTELQTQFDAAQARVAELESAAGQLSEARTLAETLQTELTSLKAANALREMRQSVSKDTGVPAELITADTEEAARAQADAILKWHGAQPKYPATNDGGEQTSPTGGTTREQFAQWASAALNQS